MADALQALSGFVMDLRVAGMAFMVAFAFAAFHAPPATASLALLDCQACIGCSPGTTPLPDEDCEFCAEKPPDPGYTYCSCCEGLDEEPHCCWDIEN